MQGAVKPTTGCRDWREVLATAVGRSGRRRRKWVVDGRGIVVAVVGFMELCEVLVMAPAPEC